MKSYALAVVGLIFLLWLLALAGSVSAAGNTYTVNTTSYTNDGSCDPLSSGDCTIWEAINAAIGGDVDTIAFDIPFTDTNYGYNTTGVWTIVLTRNLPSVTGEIVDGTTQAMNVVSDANPYGPEIEISGEGQGSYQTSWPIGSNNTIKGLAINRCSYYCLVVNGDGNTIIGNYIGTDATGSTDVTDGLSGILLGNGTDNNVIGGPSDADRNVISGLTQGGIRIFQTTGNTTGNVIQGNYIGTDRTGTQPVGNGYGIKIESEAHDNTIGPGNVIAFNSEDGVWVHDQNTDGNTITQNSIHSNGDLGIDLTNDGNDSVEAPVFSSHTCHSASGTAPINAAVELFTGPDDEGQTYLTTVFADGSGNWSASGFLADETYLTATATDTDGNTSEFSSVAGCGLRGYVPLAAKRY